jgi:4a-hydroxytetrahydrobiopterin dehydratase
MTRPGRLDVSVIDEALAAASSPWTREGEKLVFERTFPTFAEGIAFVDAVAREADAMDHHPDITIRYTRVRLEVSTHDAGGLTTLDLDLAKAVSSL